MRRLLRATVTVPALLYYTLVLLVIALPIVMSR